jgi:predicted dehydrogenase
MDDFKIGVVGTIRGNTFIEILQALGGSARLWAVCESDAEKAAQIKEKIPQDVAVYGSYDEFLDSGIDAVILCNYFHEHTALAIQAMQKGIHVLSDTTAAPTMGECVALCRAAEQTNAKYMLGVNGSFKKCIQFIRNQYNEGKLGKLYYAEAEYLHPSTDRWDDNDPHWRRRLPGTYYNMHTLGTLMYATNAVPKKVTARAIYDEDSIKRLNKQVDHIAAYSLCEMDNGAVYNVTGCANFGPTSKWFRLIGEQGVMETRRYDETTVYFASAKDHFFPDEPIPQIEEYHPSYADLHMVSEEEFSQFTEEQMKLGHSGIDFWMMINFVKYLKGEYEPFFNVYRAAALSAAAILGWRSILNHCAEYEIPDFSKEEQRKLYENDFLSPFVEKDDPNYISRVFR